MELDTKTRRMRVLIADDEDVALDLMTAIAEEAGYEVETAADGEQAWEKIAKDQVRLVVSDWQMPGVDGIELCKRIRSSNLPGYVYIVLVTGNNTPEDIVTGLSAGADDFITKPFNPAELQVRLRAGERILALETRDVAILAMAKLAESRDPETGKHLERIQAYCRILADYLYKQPEMDGEMGVDFTRMIELTSPLHDIGKIGVPDSILLKPGRLNNEEFEIMKMHATIGGESLNAALERYPNARYLRMAYDIAMSHHERYDGTGYPSGLKGDEIPLSARIAGLADVYDALTTKRPYKEAFTHIVARNMIVEDSGKHFDPRIVDAFLACEKEFMETRREITENPGE